MPPTGSTKWVSVLAVAMLLAACHARGYRATIEATAIRSIDNELVHRLSKMARARGFAVNVEGQELSAVPLDRRSVYSKVLSEMPRDMIVLNVFFRGIDSGAARIVVVPWPVTTS